MNPYTVNITLDALCIVISILIIYCLLISDFKKEKLNRPFIFMLSFNLLALTCDMLSWIFDGTVYPYSRIILEVTNFGVYLFAYLMIASFSVYLINYISLRAKIDKRLLFIIYGIASTAIIILIISQFTKTYYYIDANNCFHRSSLFWVSYIWGLSMVIFNITITLIHFKSLGKNDGLVLLSYPLVPVIIVVTQVFIAGFSLIYVSSIITELLIYIRIHLDQSKRLKEKELELANSQIDIMLSQIQPHFMYNTLTTVNNLINENPEQASVLLMDFTRYLRENMDSLTQRELVPFDRELEHLKIYLKIEKMRFEERLNVCYDLEITDFILPILSVQPLVENAVRHGVNKKKRGGTVTVATRKMPECIQVIVSDDGVGFDSEKPATDGRSHVGLLNVQHRLLSQCGGTLTIESKIGKGTTATINLPYRRLSQ